MLPNSVQNQYESIYKSKFIWLSATKATAIIFNFQPYLIIKAAKLIWAKYCLKNWSISLCNGVKGLQIDNTANM